MRWWWGLLCSIDQHAELDLYSASSLKQQSVVDMSLYSGHILTPNQPVFTLTPLCCAFSGEATDASFIVFGLTRPGLEHTIYRIRNEHANHYTTNAVYFELWRLDKKTVRNIEMSNIYIYVTTIHKNTEKYKVSYWGRIFRKNCFTNDKNDPCRIKLVRH